MSSFEQLLGPELDAWRHAGLTATFWWRDDDAVTDTPQLRQLLAIATDLAIIPALAVVPERANQSLGALLATTNFCIWQHGWGHHFFTDGEFGEGRAIGPMAQDALAGQGALDRLFGPTGWQRVFVPPNHALSMAFKSITPALGYLGVSAGVPLTARLGRVVEVNAETDVMNWYQGEILGIEAISASIIDQLVSRRTGKSPMRQPVGILTHHLVFNDAAWSLISRLWRFLRSHPAVAIGRADTLFADSLDVVVPERMEAGGAEEVGVTVVITSCGRQDLLARTIDSFLLHNTFPVRDFVVIEDGGAEANRMLEQRYRERGIRWLATGERVGQMAAIDIAYREVRTEYIFHCEDDWEFFAPGFIEKSLVVLQHNAGIVQVWIRALSDTNNVPVMDFEFVANGVAYRLLQPGFDSGEWGIWHGFSLNPGLRRRRDYLAAGPFGAIDPSWQRRSWEAEREASERYLKRGFLAAILTDCGGQGYVRHLGWGRRVDSTNGR